jgi:hypothetical protein
MDSSYPLILNGQLTKKSEARPFINAISDPGILRSTGGYLFRSCLLDGSLQLGIVPAISEGERLHHYDIKIPGVEQLIGSISATGEFTLLFKAVKADLDIESRKRWKNGFKAFASVLIDLGYDGKGTLDWITKQIIEESEIFTPVPETLFEIAKGG